MTKPTPKPLDHHTVLVEKSRIENAGRLHWFHWLIILASLLLTYTAWSIANSQHEIQVKYRFEREEDQIIQLIAERMRKYEDTLWSAVAFIQSQKDDDISSQLWRDYSRALQIEAKYPGINGIGVILHMNRGTEEKFLEEQRRQRPNFNIYPIHNQNELFPITYIEPVESNAAAVGLDIAHESNRFTAAKMARDTGQAQITGPIILVQDAQRTPGFLFYAPYFKNGPPETLDSRRQNFVGMVYAPFIFAKLMEGTLESERRHVGLTIVDDGQVLYDENQPDRPDYDATPLFKTVVPMEMYGRRWSIEVRSNKSFRQASNNNKPWLILIFGALIDAFLLGIFLLLAKANRRAATFATQLAESHEANFKKMSNIIESAVDGLITINEHGKIEEFNRACCKLFGYTPSEVTEKNISLVIPHLSISEDTLLGEAVEVSAMHKSGRFFPAELSWSTLEIQGRKIYSGIIRDISRRKDAEATIFKTMSDLELSNADLEKFAYVASHDLKSPLRAIDNLSAWLEEDLGENIDETSKDRIALLRGRVRRMEKLLDDLLQYSRADHKTHSPDRMSAFDLVSEVHNVLDVPEGFNVLIDDSLKGLEISRMPLRQIFQNLMNNAVKHHGGSIGQIYVTGRDVGKTLEFTVADDGQGIDKMYHEKIFEMFQTLKRRDEVEASGMGLAIVKKIILRNGGNIHVISEPGTGSKFVFTWQKPTGSATSDIVSQDSPWP